MTKPHTAAPRRPHRSALFVGAFAALVASAAPDGSAPPARAQDAEPGPWFSKRIMGSFTEVSRVAAAPDGSVVVSGRGFPSMLPRPVADPGVSGDPPPFVTKYGADGAQQWSASFPIRPWSGDPRPRALRVAGDGSVWVTGRGELAGVPRALPDPAGDRRDDEAWIVRLESDGTLALAMHLGGTGEDRPTSLVVTPDGDAIVAGFTSSLDFPAVAPFQASHSGGGTDGFVARVRADGSGVAWASFLGGSALERGADLAAHPSGDVFAVVHGDFVFDSDVVQGAEYTDAGPVRLVRISSEGALVTDEFLPRGTTTPGVSSPVRIAVAPDGAVLVAATDVFPAGTPGGRDRAFVLRRPPEGGPATVLWSASGSDAGRIVVSPAGDVLLGGWNGYVPFPPNTGRVQSLRILRGDPLTATDVLAEHDGTWSVTDFDVSPDGALWVVGIGRAPAFGAGSNVPYGNDPFIARLPLTVSAPRAAFRVDSASVRQVTLRWLSGGDAPERWAVERLVGREASHEGWRTEASVPGTARSARVDQLGAGAEHRFRLVAEYGSGLRIVADAASGSTRPKAPIRVVAARRPTYVSVSWIHTNLREDVQFDVQRRVGGGRWQPVDLDSWDPDGHIRGELREPLPRAPGVPVVYRVRTVLHDPDGRWVSRWATSRAVVR